MNKKDESSVMARGRCRGVALGVVGGSGCENMGLWLSIGLAIGVGVGCAFDHSQKDENDSKNNDNGKDKK